jgi:hypothetical protein
MILTKTPTQMIILLPITAMLTELIMEILTVMPMLPTTETLTAIHMEDTLIPVHIMETITDLTETKEVLTILSQ